MNITIHEEECWLCGEEKGEGVRMTRHHTIPKHLKPKKNVIVPVCEGCHSRINKIDYNGMIAHSHSMLKAYEGIQKEMKVLFNNFKEAKDETE